MHLEYNVVDLFILEIKLISKQLLSRYSSMNDFLIAKFGA